MVEPSRFHYQPLATPTSFRLIDILPGTPGDRLRCRLYNTDLEQNPEYEAISYVWGHENDKLPLLCNGTDFYITQNLASALTHFHNPVATRTVWADSICIDQASMTEKTHQVACMSRIYQNASQVLVWLGDEPFMDQAMAAIVLLQERVAPRIDEVGQYEGRTMDDRRHSVELLAKFDIPAAESDMFQSLNLLFQCSWFNRAWTFQESYLAQTRTFYFGHYRIGNMVLYYTFDILYRLQWAGFGDGTFKFEPRQIIPMLLTLQSFPAQPFASKDYVEFLILLDSRRGSGCKLPVDCLYSLLALMPNEMTVKPDYSKSFQAVFAEFALNCIESMQSLAIFSNVAPDVRNSDLPTWVPDWRVSMPPNRETFTSPGLRRYSCSGSSTPQVSVSTDWKELMIKGLRCGEIVWAGDALSAVAHPGTSDPHPELDGTTGFPLGEGDAQSWYTRLRIIGTDLAFYDETNPNSRWNDSVFPWYQELVAETELEESPKKGKLTYQLGRRTLGRCMIMTSEQRLGMAPDLAKPGDVVALLFGGEVPILLRPYDDKYIFIGECFVDGIMDGQRLTEARQHTSSGDFDSDDSWLDRLHTEPFPFDAETFHII